MSWPPFSSVLVFELFEREGFRVEYSFHSARAPLFLTGIHIA